MPDWAYCDLLISGPDVPRVLRSIESEAKADETYTAFDFNKVIPMPPSLNVEAGSQSEVAYLCAKNEGLGHYADYPWVKDNGITTPAELCKHFAQVFKDSDRPEDHDYNDYDTMVALGHQLIENERLYGAQTWYEWAYENWGTKWNAVYSTVRDHDDDGARITFQTAWSPPLPVVHALSRQFPDHTFTLIYEDPYIIEVTMYEVVFRGGEILRDSRPGGPDESDEDEAIVLALVCTQCKGRWRWWHEVFNHPCGHTRQDDCFFSEPPDAPAEFFLCGCDHCGDATNQ
jgi:hypothetical protein